MSQEIPFKKGDHVVYPMHGVGTVLDVEEAKFDNVSLKLIVVRIENERLTLRIPINKVDNLGLRSLSSKKIMQSAMKTLKGRAKTKRMMWSRRAQEYEAKINSGDPISIAEVIRDLYRDTNQPEQSFSERQIFQTAFNRLSHEIAAIEAIEPATAIIRLEKHLKTA